MEKSICKIKFKIKKSVTILQSCFHVNGATYICGRRDSLAILFLTSHIVDGTFNKRNTKLVVLAI